MVFATTDVKCACFIPIPSNHVALHFRGYCHDMHSNVYSHFFLSYMSVRFGDVNVNIIVSFHYKTLPVVFLWFYPKLV